MSKTSQSEWDRVNKVFKQADLLEKLIQLKLEAPGMTRKKAMEWAVEMVKKHTPEPK